MKRIAAGFVRSFGVEVVNIGQAAAQNDGIGVQQGDDAAHAAAEGVQESLKNRSAVRLAVMGPGHDGFGGQRLTVGPLVSGR